MKNNLNPKRKEEIEKDMNQVWRQASNATSFMILSSLGSFLLVFLVIFFLIRNRIDATLVIPFALFAALMIMIATQIILRKIMNQKRENEHA